MDAYRIAHTKLAEIAKALVPEDRIEALFARVMSLVPPAELQDILGERPLSPLTSDEQRRISDLVQQGFRAWQDFHKRYSGQHRQIRDLDPGQAQWADLFQFVTAHLGAQAAEGFSALSFHLDEGEVKEASRQATVVRLKDGIAYSCSDYGGEQVMNANSERAEPLGLNHPEVASMLRDLAFVDAACGAAHVRWPDGVALPFEDVQRPFGVVAVSKQTIRMVQGQPIESGTSLHLGVVRAEGDIRVVEGEAKGKLFRGLLEAAIRRETERNEALLSAIAAQEECLINDLRRPTEADRENRLVHAVTPLLAAVVW